MKNVLVFILMIVAVTVNAQVIEVLESKVVKGDPMTDSLDRTVWSGQHINIISQSDGRTAIVLHNPEHIFTSTVKAKVGLYNSKDSLLLISEIWVTQKNDASTILYLFKGYTKEINEYNEPIVSEKEGNKDSNDNMATILQYSGLITAERVLEFLTKTDGYIRIITPIYGGGNFDVRAKINT